jgi:hypothetical protein
MYVTQSALDLVDHCDRYPEEVRGLFSLPAVVGVQPINIRN